VVAKAGVRMSGDGEYDGDGATGRDDADFNDIADLSAVAMGHRLRGFGVNLLVRDVAREQGRRVSAPMRLVAIVREILVLQRLFTSSRKKDLSRLLTHPRFRAACNFFTLLEQAGLADRADCPGWARIEDLERKSRRRDSGGRGVAPAGRAAGENAGRCAGLAQAGGRRRVTLAVVAIGANSGRCVAAAEGETAEGAA